MHIALMPAAAQAVHTEVEAKPGLPVFKRRWWHRRDRLDARPVLWSLRNHPEEWRPTFMCIEHVPSQHQFWLAWPCNGLYRARACSCDSGGDETRFQIFQNFWFRREGRRFLRNYQERAEPAEQRIAQFASHFIR